jgi:hypothetical protein
MARRKQQNVVALLDSQEKILSAIEDSDKYLTGGSI